MKKKLFAMLAAAVMACCALTAPTSAAETYKMGDVNMDGSIDFADSILMLWEYTQTVVVQNNSTLTPEQLELTKVLDEKNMIKFNGSLLVCAIITLQYATECMVQPETAEIDIVTWSEQTHPQ